MLKWKLNSQAQKQRIQEHECKYRRQVLVSVKLLGHSGLCCGLWLGKLRRQGPGSAKTPKEHCRLGVAAVVVAATRANTR